MLELTERKLHLIHLPVTRLHAAPSMEQWTYAILFSQHLIFEGFLIVLPDDPRGAGNHGAP